MRMFSEYTGLLQPIAMLGIFGVILYSERLADTASGMLTMFGLIAICGIIAALGNKKSAATRGANSGNGNRKTSYSYYI